MSDAPDLCEHVLPGAWPFQVELVLDEHLGPADVLMRCRACGRFYLLEMLDLQGPARVMRVAVLETADAESLIRDLARGSCDVNRAGAEVQHLRTRAPLLPRLILVDTGGPTVTAVVDVPADVRVPGRSWRELPCDGSWVDYVQSRSATPDRTARW